jgi:tartrate dehydrogenase/decarboxylase/D-malate dehydrogenase
MITLPKPSGGAVVLRCSEPVLHWIVPRKIASMDRGEPDLGPSRRGLEDIGKQPSENKIAVIGGDGIGPEVVEAGIRVLEAATEGDGSSALTFTRFPWGCEYYLEHGRMMPEDGLETLAGFDAIYLGAVGWPTVPDHISLWGLLLPIRRGFDQYVNLRPARLLRGIESPLARPGSLDVTVVRENTEGEYSDSGGRMYRGTPHEVVIQESVFTRRGVERIVRYAYEEAGRRRGGLVGATKSNGISITMPFFDEVFREVGEEYPDVEASLMHADALAARLVLDPERFDVIVGSNLLGDILSEVTAAASGAIGIAPSGNLNPEREYPSLFEPIHGSAPDIAGEGVANPAGAIWAGAMMLEQVGRPEAGKLVLAALEEAISGGAKTRDLSGSTTTKEVTEVVIDHLRKR